MWPFKDNRIVKYSRSTAKNNYTMVYNEFERKRKELEERIITLERKLGDFDIFIRKDNLLRRDIYDVNGIVSCKGFVLNINDLTFRTFDDGKFYNVDDNYTNRNIKKGFSGILKIIEENKERNEELKQIKLELEKVNEEFERFQYIEMKRNSYM